MKKTILLLLVLGSCFFTLQAQSDGDSIALCGTKLYSVDKGALLDVAVGSNDRPASVPECVEGIDEFKNYFRLHPIKDGRGAGMIFKISIAFQVNCNGETLGWRVLSIYNNKLFPELAAKALEVAKEAPLHWTPAKDADGNAVDCWQVIDFTVVECSLAKCDYIR